MQQVCQNSYPSIRGSKHINQPLYLLDEKIPFLSKFGSNHTHQICVLHFTTQFLLLTTAKKKALENTVGKGEYSGNQHFLLCPQCFLLYQREIIIIATVNLSSANVFSLVTSKISLFGKGSMGKKLVKKVENCFCPFLTLFVRSLLPWGILNSKLFGKGLRLYLTVSS